MRDNRATNSRIAVAVACLITAVYYAFLFPSPEFPVFNRDDGSSFMTLGINLAEFGRYSLDTLRVEPFGLHAVWPPVFPLLLAGVISVAGVSWVAIKIAMVTFGLLALYLFWRLLAQEPEGRYAVWLTAMSPAFFLFSHHTMSEMPFLVIVAATLIVLGYTRYPATAFFAGVLGAVAFLTRGYGITLLPTGIIFFLLIADYPIDRRVRNSVVFALPMLLAMLGWIAYSEWALSTGNVDGFTRSFGSTIDVMQQRLDRSPVSYLRQLYWHELRYPVYLMMPVFELSTVRENDAPFILSLALFLILVAGWVSQAKRGMRPLDIWPPLTIVLIIAKANPAARYWLIFLPFLFYYFLIGVQLFPWPDQWRVWVRRSAFLLLGAACSVGLIEHLRNPDHLRFADPSLRELQAMSVWASSNLPEDAVLISYDAGITYNSTGRRSAAFRGEWSASMLPQSLLAYGNLYVICPTAADPDQLAFLARAVCEHLRERYEMHRLYNRSLLELYSVQATGLDADGDGP